MASKKILDEEITHFQFSLWDSQRCISKESDDNCLSILFMRFMGNVSVPTKKARFAFNSLYEIQVFWTTWLNASWILSILFMRFKRIFDKTILAKNLFQFSLWDSWLHFRKNEKKCYFQFSLWDSLVRAKA